MSHGGNPAHRRFPALAVSLLLTAALLAGLAPARAEVADLPDPAPAEEAPSGEESAPAAEADAAPLPAAKGNHTGENDFVRKWRHLRQALEDFTTYDFKDGMFQIRVSGRMQIDATMAQGSQRLEDAVGTLDDSVNFRRVRLNARGRFLRRWEYLFEYEFAGVDGGVKSAYIEGGQALKFARMRLGNFKEPFSLQRQESAFNFGFLEWSLPVATFAPGRNLGIQFHNNHLGGRLAWAAGVFAIGTDTDDNGGNSDLNVNVRLSGAPFFKEDGRYLVHLGASYSARLASDNTVRYRSRPEARFVQFLIDTGDIPANSLNLVGLEFATVQGPWWLQGEYIRAFVNSDDTGDPQFHGWYVEGGYWFTGENRIYQKRNGTFGRLIPRNPYRGGNMAKQGVGRGAFGIAARYNTVDLSDQAVRAGEMTDLNIGFNWQLNRANRITLNYIHSKVEDGGSANIYLLRYQFFP